MSELRVAVIGAGTIGSAVIEHLRVGAVPGAVFVGTLGRAGGVSALSDLLDLEPRAVVEAAGQDAVRDFGADVLAAGCDLYCLSVGAFADPELPVALLEAAATGGSRIVIPCGAAGGLDALAAAAVTGLDEVVVEQRKPAAAVLDAAEAQSLREPRVVFDGTAAEIVALYPRSTNVAAAVALAGIGFERTRARLVADPEAKANSVTLTASGPLGRITVLLENVPSANPRTSAVVASSVIAALRRSTGRLSVPG